MLAALGGFGATISGFTPDRGPTGTEVTIVGTGLQTAAMVFFGSTQAAGEIVSVSATSVRARVPPNALTGQISVFTTGSGTATSAQLFIAAPRIEDVDPVSGGPGTLVTISGVNFATGFGGRGNITNVLFNGIRAVFELTGIGQLLTVVPTNASTGPITVANEAGSFTTLASFQVPAVLTGFIPARGAPGDTVEIRGRNLNDTLRVEFGQAQAAFSVVSATNLTAIVPTNAVDARLQVTTPAGLATTTSNFVVTPRIITFTPAFGRPGTNVVLEGGGFHGVTEVRFNGVRAVTVTPQSSTRVMAVVPNGATTGPIALVTPNGTNTTTASFVIPPRLTSFTPTTGRRGDVITVDGQNLDGVTNVLVHGVPAGFTLVSPTRLSATVPALATTGPISLASVAGVETSAGNFTVGPVLDGFTPTSGPAGTAVTLIGAGLTNLALVRLGDLDATFTVINSTNVRVIVPLNSFSGPISVHTASGLEAQAPGNFFVDGARPALDAFAPGAGDPGTTVVLSGHGLRTTTRVEFNGTQAEYTVVSSTEVRAIVPAGATTGPIAITTLDGIAVSIEPFVAGGTGAPSLTIEAGTSTVTLRWPMTPEEYVLEEAMQLGPAPDWREITEEPLADGGNLSVTLELAPGGARFYRLRR
jgi:hypothetical protein